MNHSIKFFLLLAAVPFVAGCSSGLNQKGPVSEEPAAEIVEEEPVKEDPLNAILSSGDPSRCAEFVEEAERRFCLNQFPVMNEIEEADETEKEEAETAAP